MTPLKILVIDDDPHICELITLYGENNGYEMMTAYDGMDGLQKFFDESPDLIVLDIMLPEMDGWEVCRHIQQEKPTPIIMLTGKGESYDKIKGLELGADDYLVKPFDPKELMARIKAVLRRGLALPDNREIRLPSLSIDLKQYQVQCRGEEITLPPKEMDLLTFFSTHPNRVFTRQQLLDQIWGYDYEGDPRTVDVHIKRIREKLGDTPYWSFKTIRGIGYKFEVTANDAN